MDKTQKLSTKSAKSMLGELFWFIVIHGSSHLAFQADDNLNLTNGISVLGLIKLFAGARTRRRTHTNRRAVDNSYEYKIERKI